MLLVPLRRCCAFGTETHVSFVRNRTAERQRRQGADQIESRTLLGKQPFAQRVQHRPRRGGQWQVKGAALAVLGGIRGAILPLRMAPFVSRAALGTSRAAPRKAGSLQLREYPL